MCESSRLEHRILILPSADAPSKDQVVVIPKGMPVERASTLAGTIIEKVKENDPKGWTWGDIKRLLAGEGFLFPRTVDIGPTWD